MGQFTKDFLEQTKANQAFLQQNYKQNEFDLVDHYHYLCQLAYVYRAIEVKMNEFFTHDDDAFPSFLLDRYQPINKDLVFLDNKIDNIIKQNKICEATSKYVRYIKALT